MRQKLLVIDDSLTVRKLVELSFRDAGWMMDFAVSGGEGLSKALSSAPDLVLLDYVLPDMKATEVCERLAASRKSSAWPSIILMSAKMERVRDQFKPYDGWFAEIRPVGSIAWKLACVASGEGDLNISVAPKNEWDVCAGDVLVREAGGVYVGFDRTTRRYNQPKTLIEAGMCAGSPALVDAFLERERARTS